MNNELCDDHFCSVVVIDIILKTVLILSIVTFEAELDREVLSSFRYIEGSYRTAKWTK